MKSARILVVEDNFLSRLLLGDILALRGHRMVEATSGAEARSHLDGARPDLVLLGLGVPGGGEGLLREIRANPRLRELPVVAVTARALAGERERLLSSGFDGCLTKPIEVHSFGFAVESFLWRAA